MKTKLLLVIVLLSAVFAASVFKAAAQEPEVVPRAFAPVIARSGTPVRPPPTPAPTATTVRPPPTPVVSGSCWHPRYDELADHVGETVCYEQVYIEHVYDVHTGEGIECAFLASVFLKEGYVDPDPPDGSGIPGYFYNDWWAALVWVEDHSGPCEGISQGQEMPLTAEVLGTQGMAGRTYYDGITIPSLEVK